MDLHRNLTPAVLAYEGIQYQYMAPNVFTNREYDYIQDPDRGCSVTPRSASVPQRVNIF